MAAPSGTCSMPKKPAKAPSPASAKTVLRALAKRPKAAVQKPAKVAAKRPGGPAPADTRERIATALEAIDRKSTRLNSSHGYISYAVFCLKKKKTEKKQKQLQVK